MDTEQEAPPTEHPTSFEELQLSEARLAAIEAQGWTTPTPIQQQAILPALGGRDIVGIAQTGTGKTAAFMLPSLEKIEAGGGLQVLVLCPTRELAQQVQLDTEELAKGTSIRSSSIVGGVSYGPQNDALREGHEVISATPGRLIDHLRRGNVKAGGVKVVILDEADRMLDMGFRPQIEEVIKAVPRDRQTMLFSATMPHGVHDLALRLTRDAQWVEVAPQGTTAEGIEERVYTVKPELKSELLIKLLDGPGWDQVLVFSRTKIGADTLKSRLEKAGVPTDTIHSDRQMRHRTRALDRFAEGRVRVLVATDIAQRGLDIEGISHVVNYDVPLDPEDYVHRIGRTGRAGAVGTAITFVTAGDFGALKTLEHHLGRPIERIREEGFDYAGEPGKGFRHRERTRGGFGKKSPDELSPEELAALLNFES